MPQEPTIRCRPTVMQKHTSGVSLDSFIRKITFQEIRPEGMKAIGPAIEIMAANEQLDAHKNAVSVRLRDINCKS